jgi:flagellar export protein FliJ
VKSLKILRRLHQFKLDEHKRKVGELNRLLSEAEQRLQDLIKSHVREQEKQKENLLKDADSTGGLYGQYVIGFDEKRRLFNKEIMDLKKDLFVATEHMMVAFQDAKKIEIIHERQQLDMKKAELAEEIKLFDELGGRRKG